MRHRFWRESATRRLTRLPPVFLPGPKRDAFDVPMDGEWRVAEQFTSALFGLATSVDDVERAGFDFRKRHLEAILN